MTYEWLSDVNSWGGHIPFAFELVKYYKPKTMVELGTHKGDSYFAFCNAALQYNIDCKCYAVDTWEGDRHAGFYDSNVFDNVSKYNEKFNFSTLLKMQFDKAKNYFTDHEIDILHIDGLHTYDAVKHDFNNWIEKVSLDGVILLHDTQVKKDDFGVFKFWEELKEIYEYNFEFTNSNGLGVIFLNDNEFRERLITLIR